MTDWFKSLPKISSTPFKVPDTLPALPATPQKGSATGGATPAKAPWKKAVMPTELPLEQQRISAAVVMQHFRRSEIALINANDVALLQKLIARLQATPEFSKMSDKDIGLLIQRMQFRLQKAELTINFMAKDYFERENTWTEYSQMYARGASTTTQADGSKKFETRLRANGMNQPGQRDAFDTKTTFRPASDPKQAAQSQGIDRFMKTDGLTQVSKDEFRVNNTNFNPHTRQRFAALNYGRRPTGSLSDYGRHYFVLNDALKENAIYHPGDTFAAGANVASRVTYGTLFGIAAYASDKLYAELLDTCFREININGAGNGVYCIEAHLFQDMPFSRSFKEMRVSRMGLGMETAFLQGDEEELKNLPGTIMKNAKSFCNRNKIKLVEID
jgi:hypothetical protein